MVFKNLAEAVEELRKHPESPAQADLGDMAVELRVIPADVSPRRLGDRLASLGPWEGESAEELAGRLREARADGGSSEPPLL